MVKIPRFVKAYQEAGAFHSLLAPHRFIDESVFLTKGNQLGVVLRARGIDYECLTEETLESYTKRASAAWGSFDERFRVYQYVLKQDRAPIEQTDNYPNEAVRKTVGDRRSHLSSKAAGLYTLELFYVLLYEESVTKKSGTQQKGFDETDPAPSRSRAGAKSVNAHGPCSRISARDWRSAKHYNPRQAEGVRILSPSGEP